MTVISETINLLFDPLFDHSYPPVLTKRDFVRRYKVGEFGNHSPTWDTPQQLIAAKYDGGLVHLRNRVVGGATYYNLTVIECLHQWATVVAEPSSFYCSAMAPHDRGTLQGEVQQLPAVGTQLTYTTDKLPMREAFRCSQLSTSGIIAVCLLRTHMCPNSYEWLKVLLERYPDHVIEFSCFNTNWGTLSNFNTVFWEVRNY